jgi:hypothetical protein
MQIDMPAYDVLRKVPGGRECCGSFLTLEIAQKKLAEFKKLKSGDYIIIDQDSGLTVVEKFADDETSD